MDGDPSAAHAGSHGVDDDGVTPLPRAAAGLPDSALALAHRQLGLLTTAQLRESGVTRAQVRWALTRRWTCPLPGVVLLGEGPLDADQRAVAAVLYGGPSSALTGLSAAARYGVKAAVRSPELADVVVPARCAARRTAWVAVHRTTVEDSDARIVRGARLASPARAVVDAARWVRDDETAQSIVIEACQRRLTTPAALADQLALLVCAPGTARARRAVDVAAAGAWSIPEARLAAAVARSAVLPPPLLNPRLRASGRRLVSPDMWFDDVALAVMVHSKVHHAVGGDWVATVEDDGDLVAFGIVVIGVTPTTVFRDPDRAVRRIERAYAAASARRRPGGIVATPRDPSGGHPLPWAG